MRKRKIAERSFRGLYLEVIFGDSVMAGSSRRRILFGYGPWLVFDSLTRRVPRRVRAKKKNRKL
jgi:hypothetical protein